MGKKRLLIGLLVAALATTASPALASGSGDAEKVIVWGRGTAAAHDAVDAAGGEVDTTLDLIGGWSRS